MLYRIIVGFVFRNILMPFFSLQLYSELIGSTFFYYFSGRKSYKPMDMYSLQRMIDLGRIDVKSPIDLATITNTRLFHVNVEKQEHGLWLTEDVSQQKPTTND